MADELFTLKPATTTARIAARLPEIEAALSRGVTYRQLLAALGVDVGIDPGRKNSLTLFYQAIARARKKVAAGKLRPQPAAAPEPPMAPAAVRPEAPASKHGFGSPKPHNPIFDDDK